jgi:hypothetical protein
MKLEEIVIGNNLTGVEPTLVVNVVAVRLQDSRWNDSRPPPRTRGRRFNQYRHRDFFGTAYGQSGDCANAKAISHSPAGKLSI